LPIFSVKKTKKYSIRNWARQSSNKNHRSCLRLWTVCNSSWQWFRRLNWEKI